jgi:hypothetical protein
MSNPSSTTKVYAAIAAACFFTGLIYVITFGLTLRGSEDAKTAGIPNFAPDTITSWFPDRSAGDDFLPPESGPGPVMPHKDYPYVPNNEGQPTYRVADLSNPILQPWVVEQMKKGE